MPDDDDDDDDDDDLQTLQSVQLPFFINGEQL
jgi:hypothetical protein